MIAHRFELGKTHCLEKSRIFYGSGLVHQARHQLVIAVKLKQNSTKIVILFPSFAETVTDRDFDN